jgi:hypothetical protein
LEQLISGMMMIEVGTFKYGAGVIITQVWRFESKTQISTGFKEQYFKQT